MEVAKTLVLNQRLSQAAHWAHAHFLYLLLAVYGLAALVPGPGLALRAIKLGNVQFVGPLNIPALLLAFLLFNAGFGTRSAALRDWRRSGIALACGTLANLLVPVAFLLFLHGGLHFWHNPDEVQNILVGLALVASMPIAGSSTAWSQNSSGDLTLSLGLVLLSTVLSPLTTPFLLHIGGWITTGDYSEDLHELAGQGSGQFLLFFVLAPSLLGMAVRWLAGDRQVPTIQPALKFCNTVALLILCYANAAVSLPQVVAKPDSDFLVLTALITVALSMVAFSSGLLLARLLKLGRPQQAALVFGLGMSNNGTGLVIAAGTLGDHPLVLLPILLYNLIQHLVAGAIDRLLFVKRASSSM